MTYQTILYEATNGVAKITLNRPHTLNAFTDVMLGETLKAFKQAERDKTVRAIVLTGNGRGFSSGQDLGDTQARDADESIGDHLRHTYHKLIKQMTRLEKPIIGMINGIAAGAGCGVALACDLRIASDKASFMLAFSKIGLVPDSGTNWFLPRLIGYGRAYEMAITADKIPAAKALDWGLVNQVVPHNQLEEVTMAQALRFAQGATKAYGLAKRAMYKSISMTLDAALEYEAQLQEIAGATVDFKEGVTAFAEKRAPKYKGY
ncbi:MAG: enoyl-CoA hydratase-related protein [Chloroflexota bacterium]